MRTGRWQRAHRGVYAEGSEPVSALDAARAKVLASASPARGSLAGVLHSFDGVSLVSEARRRDRLAPDRITTVGGVPCACPIQTMIDLAVVLDDDRWEQALESALRRRLVTIADFENTERWTPGGPRIRRVLARRPVGAQNLLETLMVQLTRTVPSLREPVRQHRIMLPDGTCVPRVARVPGRPTVCRVII